MKILYVAGRFPALSETFVVNEVVGHLNRGHDVRVLTMHPGTRVTPPEESTVLARVHVIPRIPVTLPRLPSRIELTVPEDHLKRRVYATLAARWATSRALRGFRPDVIHAHFLTVPTLIAGVLAEVLRIPYSFMAHCEDFAVDLTEDLLRARVLHADAGFVPSQIALAELAHRAGLNGSERAHLGVVRQVSRVRVQQRSTKPDGPLTLVSVARLVPTKGIDVGLRAFARMRSKHEDARYWIVGRGPLRAELEQLAADLGVEDAVTFFGAMPHGRTQELIAGAHVMVLPCRRGPTGRMDGLPVSLWEAGALGVPVVSTDIAGIPELVEHERTGLLAPPEDHEGLAAAIERVAADDALSGRLAAALRARVQTEFAPGLQLDRLHEAWGRLVSEAASREKEGYPRAARSSSRSISANARSAL